MRKLCLFWGPPLLFLLALSARTYAHGGGTPRLVNAEAGPYRVFAWTSPEPLRTGTIHISIAITLPVEDGEDVEKLEGNQLAQAVTDAVVQILLEPAPAQTDRQSASSDDKLHLEAKLGATNRIYYETDAELPHAGVWLTKIYVEGDVGRGETSFVSDVQPPLFINWSIVGGAGGVIIALLIFNRMRVRHNS